MTLTSLEDFKQNSAEKLASIRIKALDARIELLSQQYWSHWDLSEEDRAAALARYIGPSGIVRKQFPTAVVSRLNLMRQALEEARYGRWPVSYWPLDDNLSISVRDWKGLTLVIEETLATCTRLYEHMMNHESQVVEWKELQSPQLTELLDFIRASNPGDWAL